MTQEQKRIKLAEAGGWKRKSVDLEYPLSRPEGRWEKGELTVFHFGQLPDYFTDLNAVHELEKIVELILDSEAWKLDHWINEVVCNDVGIDVDPNLAVSLIRKATAAQRAEAIGLTLGLWEAAK